MKRLANYLIALATMAFTLTSCEDVPSPFGTVVAPPSEETVTFEPTGSGTQADPYNVAAVLEFVSGLGADTPSEKEVYIKGFVTEKTDVSAQYGNATFIMSDSKEGGNKFTVYRAAGLGGEKVTDENFIKEGDEVVVCGKVTNYKGNTPETVQGSAYVYSVNGNTGSGGGGGDTPTPGEAKGSGTLADPYNVAGANKYISGLPGDTESTEDVYIKGKIVKYANNGEFNEQYGNASFYISDDGKESSEQFYVFRTLYLGNVKYTGGDKPQVGDEVIICGKVVNYKGNTPETVANKSYIYSLNGNTSGGGGGGDNPPSGGAAGSGTLADPYNVQAIIDYVSALAADTDTNKDLYVKGIVTEIPNNGISTQYNNLTFYISDDTAGSNKFYVFRAKGLDGGDVTENMIKVGDEVVIFGSTWVNYKGNTPETKQGAAYIVSINSGTGGGGGSEAGTGADGSTIITVADFIAVAESTSVWYQLTGVVKNLKADDQYGNFDLEDSTGSVYVYGLLSEKGGAKKQFQALAAEKGIQNGSTLTIVGNRGSYNGKIEVTNAYFISVSN